MKNALFDMPREPLVLEIQDIAPEDLDDPLEIWLARKGWKIRQVRGLQESISAKRTVDMFTKEPTPLNEIERHFQRAVDIYLKGE